jgi:hypothetical protein
MRRIGRVDRKDCIRRKIVLEHRQGSTRALNSLNILLALVLREGSATVGLAIPRRPNMAQVRIYGDRGKLESEAGSTIEERPQK